MGDRNQATRRAEKAIEAQYREWLWRNDMGQCFLSGRPDCDLAHVRKFTGAGWKPIPAHTLPLARGLHNVQETGGDGFWRLMGFTDPLVWTVRLFETFEQGDADSARALMADMQEQADRRSMAAIFEARAA